MRDGQGLEELRYEMRLLPSASYFVVGLRETLHLVLIGRLRDRLKVFERREAIALGLIGNKDTPDAFERRARFDDEPNVASQWKWFDIVLPIPQEPDAALPPHLRLDLVSEGNFWFFDFIEDSGLTIPLPPGLAQRRAPSSPPFLGWVRPGQAGQAAAFAPDNLWPGLIRDRGDTRAVTLTELIRSIHALIVLQMVDREAHANLERILRESLAAFEARSAEMAAAKRPAERLDSETLEIAIFILSRFLPPTAAEVFLLWCDFTGHQDVHDQACEIILGLDIAGPHRWMAEAAFVDEKRSLLQHVVMPFLGARDTPNDTGLFLDLKQQELHSLESGAPPPGVAAVIAAIDRSSSGETPDRPVSRSGSAGLRRPIHTTPFFQTALHLSWVCPDLLTDLLRGFGPAGFSDAVASCQRLLPTYLVITRLGFPMGGGEAYMHQTCKIMSELGYHVVWVSFVDGRTDRANVTTMNARTHYYRDIRLAADLGEAEVEQIIREHAPDLLHTQGAANEVVEAVARRLRIPVLVGYHFWDGLIKLGTTGNRCIAENIALHAVAKPIVPFAPVSYYVASEFMQSIYRQLGGGAEIGVHHPLPEPTHYAVRRRTDARHVVQINIARLKGGEVFLECVRHMGSSVPFLAVRTEGGSADLDEQIERAIGASPGSRYETYGDVRQWYSRARIVLIPTLVDETFCRVAFEAAMNGIPVISTGKGFLPMMLGNAGVYLDENPASWIGKLCDIIDDDAKLNAIGNRQRRHLQAKFGSPGHVFLREAIKLTAMSCRRNIGFFTAWTEQGLGNQMRLYARLFRRAGLRAHILSYQPYAAADRALTSQQVPQDWSVPDSADSVYYSFNDREVLTRREIEQFCRAYNVGTLVVPEICWCVNWDKMLSISVPNLAICPVPNIETVRRSEAPLHNRFTRSWYNTRVAQAILQAEGVTNGAYIGHGLGPAIPAADVAARIARLRQADRIVYLHVAGHNPHSRKQTLSVLNAFAVARRSRTDIRLVVTCMVDLPDLPPHLRDGLDLRIGTLGHEQVMSLYRECDVSVQVSSHEGLGLGFYESLSHAVPIVSIDIAPHNEAVIPGVSGWLLPSQAVRLADNDDAVVMGGLVDQTALARLFCDLAPKDVEALIGSTAAFFNERFTETRFLVRLLAALP